ncbi:MAG: hypothetical protein PHQ43_00775 [Dehalococcoidales bacterium]|nr:hypothetical protein [Dehalococcoidales bacterium]
MVKKMVNIRLDDWVWHQAKVSAAKDGCTLQEWLTLLILQGKQSDRVKVVHNPTTGSDYPVRPHLARDGK